VDSNRKQGIIAVVAAILAARKLASVPRNSPAAVATISDAVADLDEPFQNPQDFLSFPVVHQHSSVSCGVLTRPEFTFGALVR
jgi:hypothetical protein